MIKTCNFITNYQMTRMIKKDSFKTLKTRKFVIKFNKNMQFSHKFHILKH